MRDRWFGKLLSGGVSERPKEHASKACDGKHRPRVQIPPPPPKFSELLAWFRSSFCVNYTG